MKQIFFTTVSLLLLMTVSVNAQENKYKNGYTYNPDSIEMVYVEGNDSIASFYIGKYEITQARWKAIMNNNPSEFRGDNLPVENVSWNDAQDFINRLNAKTGRKYRLPAEREWEFAARGGAAKSFCPDGCKYSGSNNVDSVAWWRDNSAEQTHPVGTKQPNELGIYNMSGNVWEWCQDCYDNSCDDRVTRGGSWNNGEMSSRVFYRSSFGSGNVNNNLGFRLVCGLD